MDFMFKESLWRQNNRLSSFDSWSSVTTDTPHVNNDNRKQKETKAKLSLVSTQVSLNFFRKSCIFDRQAYDIIHLIWNTVVCVFISRWSLIWPQQQIFLKIHTSRTQCHFHQLPWSMSYGVHLHMWVTWNLCSLELTSNWDIFQTLIRIR